MDRTTSKKDGALDAQALAAELERLRTVISKSQTVSYPFGGRIVKAYIVKASDLERKDPDT